MSVLRCISAVVFYLACLAVSVALWVVFIKWAAAL